MYKAAALVSLTLALSACGVLPEKKPVTQMTDAEFEANFKCPETLTPEGQAKSFVELYDFAAARHPNWSTQQIAGYRATLLDRKKCQFATMKPLG